MKMQMKNSDAAVLLGGKGCSCSEAVMAAFGPCFGIDEQICMRIASGFAGGMGTPDGVCGAVSAAFMVLGLMNGPCAAGDTAGKRAAWFAVEEFAERFVARRGSMRCGDLCGETDLRDPEQAGALRRTGIPEAVVRDAAEILEEMLADR